MMASPLAKGLFHKAICESGNALDIFPGRPLAELEKIGVKLFKKLGATTLKQARKVPWDKLLQASQDLQGPLLPGFNLPTPTWDTAIDGWMLPRSPKQAFASGSYNAVPLIVLANLGELTGPGQLVMPFIINTYINMLNAGNKAKVQGYAGIFDQVPANWRKEGCTCPHSMELPYVFGDWDDTTGWWQSVVTPAQQSGAKSATAKLGAADRYVSESMMRLWTQFAKTGRPGVKGLIDWPAYTKASDQYLYVNKTLEIRSGYSGVGQGK
jgi:para-nitrobenzyl esterase